MQKIIEEFMVFNFDELNDKAKNHAIELERNNECRLDYEWWDGVYEEFYEKFKAIGITGADFYFSLAYCQGDYARIFKGEIDAEKVIKMFFPALRHNLTSFMVDYTSIYLDRHGNVIVDFDYYSGYPYITSYLEGMAAKLEKILNDKVTELNKELYKTLQDEYKALQSDEMIKEEFIDRGTLFYEDGRVYSY